MEDEIKKEELTKISIHKGETGDFISVNEENCVGCGRCIMICVVHLWKLVKGIAQIKTEYKTTCLECGGCWQVCDFNAINFSYPAGGTGVVFKNG